MICTAHVRSLCLVQSGLHVDSIFDGRERDSVCCIGFSYDWLQLTVCLQARYFNK